MPKILKNYRLPAELVARLDAYATSIGADRTELLVDAITRFLDSVAADKTSARLQALSKLPKHTKAKGTRPLE